MTSVKTHGFAKKLGALVMAMAMICALAVNAMAAGAGTYAVTVKKNNSDTASMAQDAINGSAEITVDSDGDYLVTIPVKSFEYEFLFTTYNGCIKSFTVENGSNCTVSESGEYDTATMSFTMETLPSDMKFDIGLSIELYKVSGDGSFTHPTVNADFYFV